MKKENRKKIYLFCGIAVICVFSLYLAFSLFFVNHYYFGTVIGNINCGGKTAGEVEAIIAGRAENYTLKIMGREAAEETLAAADIGVRFATSDAPERIVAEQKWYAWISSLWCDGNYDMPVTVSYEEDLLDDRMNHMVLFQKKNMKDPENAYIGEYDSENGIYPIIEGDAGTLVNLQKAKEAIVSAIENMEEVLNLEDAECYIKADIDKDDEALNQFCGRLNRFVSSRIVYDWHGIEEIVDGSVIHDWLDIDRDRQTVLVDEEAVREYVNDLSKKNDTFGKKRTFRTSEGKEIELEAGSYGWRVDRAAETDKLIGLIRRGWNGVREPEYLYTAAVKGEDDIGNSYVEIDLTAQHLYLYVEGELVTESDFVSGNVSRGFTTPDGVYGLTYKTLDATLRGQGYATPVKYWMPFNGNIGMHDAKWRKQFGGNIYLRNGSHGCINLPPEEAEKIYEQVYKGFPVICYTDPAAKKHQVKPAAPQTDPAPDEIPAEIPLPDGSVVPGTGDIPAGIPIPDVPGGVVPDTGENPASVPVPDAGDPPAAGPLPDAELPGENPAGDTVQPPVEGTGENATAAPAVPAQAPAPAVDPPADGAGY